MSRLIEAAREVKEKGSFSYLDCSLSTPQISGFTRE
jgi:hypothetical protein